MRHLLPLLLLAACTPGEVVVCQDHLRHDDWHPVGEAAWDPIFVDLDHCIECQSEEDSETRCEDAEPAFEDELGALVYAEPDSRPYLGQGWWVPPSGWSPGHVGEASYRGWVHEVGTYGRDPDFDADALAGTAWQLDPSTFRLPLDALLSDMLESQGTYILEVLDTDADRADFRLVWRHDQGACALLTDQAELSEAGELSWKRSEHLVPSQPAFQAWHLHLHLGFDSALERAAGLEAGLLVDTEPLSQHLCEDEDPRCLCTYFEVAGEACERCPGTGQAFCAPVAGYGGVLAPVEPSWPEELPACDALIGEDLIPTGCDLGCDSTGGRTAAPALLALLGLVGWRRRRR